MKKIKILIVFMIILIIILVSLLYIISQQGEIKDINKKEDNIDYKNIVFIQEDDINVHNNGDDLLEEYPDISDVDYITVNQCISSFLEIINQNNSLYFGGQGDKIIKNEEINNIILKVLSESYITKNNIDIYNLNNYVYNINKKTFFIPIEIKKFFAQERVNSFVIKGLIEDLNYNHIKEVVMILNIDTTYATFSIEIVDNTENIDSIIPSRLKEIPKNDRNNFRFANISEEETTITELNNLYKRTILGYPDIFYNRYLDNDYKIAKFKNLEEFKEYVKNNKEVIKTTNIKKYNKIENEDNDIYILENQYGDKIYIRYNNMIDYKVYLDSYTIELDSMKEIYNKGNLVTRISYNINQIKQMLNSKDYNTIYNKLNPTFKNNNFNNVYELKEYLEKNIYNINGINVVNADENDEYYVCECELINMKNETETKKVNFIIKLIDSNNFEMSFSFE